MDWMVYMDLSRKCFKQAKNEEKAKDINCSQRVVSERTQQIYDASGEDIRMLNEACIMCGASGKWWWPLSDKESRII